MRASAKSVILIIPTLRCGGAERVISRLSLYWESRDVSVKVITFDASSPGYDFGGTVIDLNLPAVSGIWGKMRQLIRRARACALWCDRIRPDRVIAFMESAGLAAIQARRYSSHEFHLTVSIRCYPLFIPWWQRWQIRRSYPSSDIVVVQTKQTLEMCCLLWGFSRNRTKIIPNPLDAHWLHLLPEFMSRQVDTVVAVGRLEPQKGFDVLIRSCAAIKAIRLIIIGEGSQRRELQELAKNLGTADRLELPGAVKDPRPWLDCAGVFVLSSRYEGFPNALAEAMARGCPIVSTDCPTGPSEMLCQGESGILVPVDDPVALTTAIRRLHDDRPLALAYGRAARRRAEDWAIEKVAHQWLSL